MQNIRTLRFVLVLVLSISLVSCSRSSDTQEVSSTPLPPALAAVVPSESSPSPTASEVAVSGAPTPAVAAHSDALRAPMFPIVVSGGCRLIDITGAQIVDLDHDDLRIQGDFSEGLAPVSRNGLYGFVDTSGTLVIEPRFQDPTISLPPVLPFSEGMAAVSVNGDWGYVDTTGHMLIPAQFDYAFSFSEGLAAVTMDGDKYGFIDKSGVLRIPMIYDDLAFSGFRDGLIPLVGN